MRAGSLLRLRDGCCHGRGRLHAPDGYRAEPRVRRRRRSAPGRCRQALRASDLVRDGRLGPVVGLAAEPQHHLGLSGQVLRLILNLGLRGGLDERHHGPRRLLRLLRFRPIAASSTGRVALALRTNVEQVAERERPLGGAPLLRRQRSEPRVEGADRARVAVVEVGRADNPQGYLAKVRMVDHCHASIVRQATQGTNLSSLSGRAGTFRESPHSVRVATAQPD